MKMYLDANKIIRFSDNFSRAINLDTQTSRNLFWIVKELLKSDKKSKTDFEFSLKIRRGALIKTARFLNMDGMAYSYKSPSLFLKRLQIYNEIMKKRINNDNREIVVAALSEIAQTPMDLYFGVDIRKNNFLFAFWLIFGGVQSPDNISFYRYDFKKIINNALQKIGFKNLKVIKNDILNFGFDVDNKEIFYKIYYLCRTKFLPRHEFSDLMRKINKNLFNYHYFYFISELYNKESQCIKKKIFVEFFDKIYSQKENIADLLNRISIASNNQFNISKMVRIFKSIGGRISLVSFEKDGTLTFYLRPY